MPDYEEMYRVLFQETTKAISALQRAQRLTEEMYMADDSPDSFNNKSPKAFPDREDETRHSPQG